MYSSYLCRKVEYRKSILIDKLVPESQIILDLGCGNGEYCNLLQRKAKLVVGVDIVKRFCVYAKRKDPNLWLVNADSCHLPFVDNAFDGVWASEILEHSQYVAFKELNRVTWKWLLATMPNPYSSNYRADSSHILVYDFNLLRCYFKTWIGWNILMRGIGIEYAASKLRLPRLIKLATLFLTWHFPQFAPTFCIWGMRSK